MGELIENLKDWAVVFQEGSLQTTHFSKLILLPQATGRRPSVYTGVTEDKKPEGRLNRGPNPCGAGRNDYF